MGPLKPGATFGSAGANIFISPGVVSSAVVDSIQNEYGVKKK
jgi:hypothetical protein